MNTYREWCVVIGEEEICPQIEDMREKGRKTIKVGAEGILTVRVPRGRLMQHRA